MVRPFRDPVNAADLPHRHGALENPLTVKAEARQTADQRASSSHQALPWNNPGVRRIKGTPSSICVVDVRNGPPEILIDRIPGALQIPQSTILARIERLPRDRTLVLYCWDTWCGLATDAAVPLLERGFDVKEMYGGINAWKTLKFPTEPVAASDLAGQVAPLPV